MRKTLLVGLAAVVGLVTLAPSTASAGNDRRDNDHKYEKSEKRDDDKDDKDDKSKKRHDDDKDEDDKDEDGDAPTLAEILLSDSAKDNADGFDHRWYDYDIVTQAVLAFPDLTAAVSDPDAELTVFLPKDYAFFRLAKQLGAPKLDEQETFNWLVANVGLETIKVVLSYHIIPGAEISAADALKSDGAKLTTLLGGDFKVEVDVRKGDRIKLIDLDTNDRDAYVIKPNIGGEAENGYAHGIGRVLRPIDLP